MLSEETIENVISRLTNRINQGNEYIYVSHRTLGSQSTNPFKEATQNSSTSHNNKANYMSFLSYYYNDYKASGAIRYIRIYNRKLTDVELAHNQAIDKARFNLSN